MPDHPARSLVGSAQDRPGTAWRAGGGRPGHPRRRPAKRAQATAAGTASRRRALFLSRPATRGDRDHRWRVICRGPRAALPRHPRAESGFPDHGGPGVNHEDALRGDIHDALDPITGSTPDLMPRIVQRLRPVSRRRPLVAIGQVAAVLGIGLVVAAVAFSLHRSRVAPPGVTTAPTTPSMSAPGANVAWVTSQQASGGFYTGDVVSGIDPTGHVVGQINAQNELRSPDGSQLYALSDGGVDVFSAVDGHKEQTISLSSTNLGVQMLSPDGRYLAVVGGSPSTLQLIDLSIGRAVASTAIESPSYGIPVIVGAHAEHVYVVGTTIARFTFDGSRLRVEQRTAGHTLACDGLVAGGSNSAGGLSFRVLADSRTLVAFCPMNGAVDWVDLAQMTLTHEVLVPQRNPFWVSPVFSSDGNTLYLYEGGTGELHVIDLLHPTIAK